MNGNVWNLDWIACYLFVAEKLEIWNLGSFTKFQDLSGLAEAHFAFTVLINLIKYPKVPEIRGSRNWPQNDSKHESKTGPLQEVKKLQNPLISLYFWASGLPEGGPVLGPLWVPFLGPIVGPDLHFLK